MLLNFTASTIPTSGINFLSLWIENFRNSGSNVEFLIISLVGEETSCPHSVTSRERVKIHAHFPHGCGTHFTIHTYLYTLAQGVKGCTRVESKLHVLTSGLSAVSVLRVCLLVQATYFSLLLLLLLGSTRLCGVTMERS